MNIKLLSFFILFLCNKEVISQIIPPSSASFKKVLILEHNLNPKTGKKLPPKTIKELNVQADIDINFNGKTTYVTFNSSIIGGESVSIVLFSETVGIDSENRARYLATSESIIHDKKYKWQFFYTNDEIQAVEFFVSDSNKSFFFLNE
ncbi:hypothetical protein [Sphingobacterium bovisgrunnientis]|uniref:hypothetical protein n=1 Tax=Sphingobacterium bovisgrunnientis TaxID=1874697 RepID=UPI0013587060|nr:hypothetical protein [Sphingobacterium bovisgrunnientis]